MATWEALTVRDAVNRISDNLIVLPVIQRRLVWDEAKMELLFDTLLKRDSFGGIMVIEEERGQVPLFAYRLFSRDGTATTSMQATTPWSATHLFIIDGQQRFQSFYIGLAGVLNGKELFFNVAGDPAVRLHEPGLIGETDFEKVCFRIGLNFFSHKTTVRDSSTSLGMTKELWTRL